MEQRPLGQTGLMVSALGFGCGSIGGLFVRGDEAEQRRAFEEAVAAGISYFDTAPGYGDGRSETNLGRVLAETRARVVVGTKVQLDQADLADASGAVRRSLEASLRRLKRDRVDLLQLHSRIVLQPDHAAGEVSSDDTLGPIADAMRAVREAGVVDHIGITGLGNTAAVGRVVDSGRFETVQSYFNALNPSAGFAGRVSPGAQDFQGLIDRAAAATMGVIVIRPLAAGALGVAGPRHPNAGDPGGALVSGGDYAEDVRQAQRRAALARELGLEGPTELALRFALAKSGVSTVIVGYSDLSQLREAIRWAERGPLDPAAVEQVIRLVEIDRERPSP
jgi:L-galactose dehydrogenase/L-glyceraldehyde 3-phosphate reductase